MGSATDPLEPPSSHRCMRSAHRHVAGVGGIGTAGDIWCMGPDLSVGDEWGGGGHRGVEMDVARLRLGHVDPLHRGRIVAGGERQHFTCCESSVARRTEYKRRANTNVGSKSMRRLKRVDG